MFFEEGTPVSHPRTGSGTVAVATFLVLLSAGVIVAAAVFVRARLEVRPDLTAVVQYIAAEHKGFAQPYNRLIMVANLADLTCPPCFDDFTALAESLSANARITRTGRVALLLTDSREGEELRGEVLKHWATETGLAFPSVAIETSLLEAFEMQKSQAVLIDSSNRLTLQKRFPIGESSRREVVSLLEAQAR
jgi:hypothetical protein